MPLPSRRKGESEDKFLSRCMSELTDKGEGKDRAQRFAICKSRASCSLSDDELAVMGNLVKEITNLNPPLKKKKKDKFRVFKEEDGEPPPGDTS